MFDLITIPDKKWMKPIPAIKEYYKDRDVMVFRVLFEYTSYAQYQEIDVKKVVSVDTLSQVYKKYAEKECSTDYLRELSQNIIKDVTNPYLKAKRIYEWISKNMTWTFPDNVSSYFECDYDAKRKRGDCGNWSDLFIKLCRLNNIPARGEGGWKVRPNRDHAAHSWAEIYIEPYGWLPVDPTFGSHLINNKNNKLKYGYFCDIDQYRLITYTGIEPTYPLGIFGSSLQLGYFEWRGGEIGDDKFNLKIDSFAEE